MSIGRAPSSVNASTRSACEAAVREWVTSNAVAPRDFTAIAQQRNHLRRTVRVEVAGRFVGQHDSRRVDERTRDRHPLQLSAGKLARHARRGRSARPTAANIALRGDFGLLAARPRSASGSATSVPLSGKGKM